jgi:predicted transposase/invertase (TIGR01784 family)
MARYLDPKNDLTFKRIFGEHDYLCISLLNSLLPLDESGRIVGIEYLPTEHAPRTPLGKNSIVDVKCRDAAGRFFIVEMQMYWSFLFMKRIVFNAAQALVKQADKDAPDGRPKTFSELQPVYTLAIVNQFFPNKDENRWIYTYKVADIENPLHVLEGLNFVVVDLETEDMVRKIRSQQGWTMEKKRMAVLWLRFLKETGYREEIDRELVEDDTIRMAVEMCREGAFTRDELDVYDAYLDHIRIELGYADAAEDYKKLRQALEETDKALKETDKALKDKNKALEDKDKALEDKDKIIEDNSKVIEDKDRLIEELKKQLTARSL